MSTTRATLLNHLICRSFRLIELSKKCKVYSQLYTLCFTLRRRGGGSGLRDSRERASQVRLRASEVRLLDCFRATPPGLPFRGAFQVRPPSQLLDRREHPAGTPGRNTRQATRQEHSESAGPVVLASNHSAAPASFESTLLPAANRSSASWHISTLPPAAPTKM